MPICGIEKANKVIILYSRQLNLYICNWKGTKIFTPWRPSDAAQGKQ